MGSNDSTQSAEQYPDQKGSRNDNSPWKVSQDPTQDLHHRGDFTSGDGKVIYDQYKPVKPNRDCSGNPSSPDDPRTRQHAGKQSPCPS